MRTRDVVVVGASAGGVQALRAVCSSLPKDLPAMVLIVQHLARNTRSVLAQVLARHASLPVTEAVQGQPLTPGQICVAPPDRHLLIHDDKLMLSRGPSENGTRPAVDALFRSAAVHCGSRVIGVILTGALDDGTEGLIAIHKAGGVCIVQDPKEAAWSSMPNSAIRRDHVQHIVPLRDMGSLIGRLAREQAGDDRVLPAEIVIEDRIAQGGPHVEPDQDQMAPGTPSVLSCPDCGGVLNEIHAEEGTRFRCQIGHAFSQLSLREAQLEEIERGLTIAMRTHRERVILFQRMARQAHARGHTHTAQRWRDEASASERLTSALHDAMEALERPDEAA